MIGALSSRRRAAVRRPQLSSRTRAAVRRPQLSSRTRAAVRRRVGIYQPVLVATPFARTIDPDMPRSAVMRGDIRVTC